MQECSLIFSKKYTPFKSKEHANISQIAMQTINRDTRPFSQISSLVEDINILVKIVKNIKFAYCSKSTDKLTGKIPKKVRHCNIQMVYL